MESPGCTANRKVNEKGQKSELFKRVPNELRPHGGLLLFFFAITHGTGHTIASNDQLISEAANFWCNKYIIKWNSSSIEHSFTERQ